MTTWYTPEHVAAELDLNVDTVRRLCRDGDLPGAKKFGTAWRIPADALNPAPPKPLIAPPSRRSLAQQRRRTA